MCPLTETEVIQFNSSITCCICNRELLVQDKVRDHCHLSGKFRGAAHRACNLQFKLPKFVPIFCHNLSGYDSHLFIRELAKFESDSLTLIPKNKENYISFSQHLFMEKSSKGRSIFMEMRFLDSFRFLSSSLDALASSMEERNFYEIKKFFPHHDSLQLLTRKGIFPYEYMDCWSKFNECALPPIEAFYSHLTNQPLSLCDYQHAQSVWNHFKIKSLGEYSDLYLKCDVLLLTDIFENFRDISHKAYGLDPCHYYTAPGLSWDAMLKYTQIEIELLSDINMIHFIKRGIRGGISQCSNRHGIANNKYMANYDRSKPSSYLAYLDANNQYAWAMSQYMPIGEFRWLEGDEISQIKICDLVKDPNVGYILEVDLEYPQDLHDLHNDLPFCAENIIPPNGISKSKKLITSLNDKHKYIIHSNVLTQALNNGLILKHIHRILTFRQSAWLKPYIDLNTNLRQNANSSFERDHYKKMNNAIYGKTMENVDKYVDVKLVTRWKNMGKRLGAETLISKPNFDSCTIFSQNFAAIQMNKTSVNYNKPIQIGFVVLELSKTLMYKFHYEFMLKKYSERLKLLYTDTDSFIYHIQTDDFYHDIRDNLDLFDTSDYPPNNRYNLPLVNKKVVGLMKDENAGSIFLEFVGLRSKMYAIRVEDRMIAKAKGVNKSVVSSLSHMDYMNCLTTKRILYKSMSRFKSIQHVIYTLIIRKRALSSNDDKRYICDSTNTLAWGHYSIR